MFIALVQFPDVPADRDTAFQEWFDWSNQQLAGAAGLRGRRLLRAAGGGYCALIEHESAATFATMHSAPVVAEIQARLRGIVPEPPRATQFEVVPPAAGGGCCAQGSGGHHDTRSSSGAAEAPAAEHLCCHAG